MRFFKLVLLLFCLITAFSCSVTKRKYNKGYFIEHKHHFAATITSNKKTDKSNPAKISINLPEAKKQEPVAETKKETRPINKIKSKIFRKDFSNKKVADKPKQKKPQHLNKKKKEEKPKKEKTPYSKRFVISFFLFLFFSGLVILIVLASIYFFENLIFFSLFFTLLGFMVNHKMKKKLSANTVTYNRKTINSMIFLIILTAIGFALYFITWLFPWGIFWWSFGRIFFQLMFLFFDLFGLRMAHLGLKEIKKSDGKEKGKAISIIMQIIYCIVAIITILLIVQTLLIFI